MENKDGSFDLRAAGSASASSEDWFRGGFPPGWDDLETEEKKAAGGSEPPQADDAPPHAAPSKVVVPSLRLQVPMAASPAPVGRGSESDRGGSYGAGPRRTKTTLIEPASATLAGEERARAGRGRAAGLDELRDDALVRSQDEVRKLTRDLEAARDQLAIKVELLNARAEENAELQSKLYELKQEMEFHKIDHQFTSWKGLPEQQDESARRADAAKEAADEAERERQSWAGFVEAATSPADNSWPGTNARDGPFAAVSSLEEERATARAELAELRLQVQLADEALRDAAQNGAKPAERIVLLNESREITSRTLAVADEVRDVDIRLGASRLQIAAERVRSLLGKLRICEARERNLNRAVIDLDTLKTALDAKASALTRDLEAAGARAESLSRELEAERRRGGGGVAVPSTAEDEAASAAARVQDLEAQVSSLAAALRELEAKRDTSGRVSQRPLPKLKLLWASRPDSVEEGDNEEAEEEGDEPALDDKDLADKEVDDVGHFVDTRPAASPSDEASSSSASSSSFAPHARAHSGELAPEPNGPLSPLARRHFHTCMFPHRLDTATTSTSSSEGGGGGNQGSPQPTSQRPVWSVSTRVIKTGSRPSSPARGDPKAWAQVSAAEAVPPEKTAPADTLQSSAPWCAALSAQRIVQIDVPPVPRAAAAATATTTAVATDEEEAPRPGGDGERAEGGKEAPPRSRLILSKTAPSSAATLGSVHQQTEAVLNAAAAPREGGAYDRNPPVMASRFGPSATARRGSTFASSHPGRATASGAVGGRLSLALTTPAGQIRPLSGPADQQSSPKSTRPFAPLESGPDSCAECRRFRKAARASGAGDMLVRQLGRDALRCPRHNQVVNQLDEAFDRESPFHPAQDHVCEWDAGRVVVQAAVDDAEACIAASEMSELGDHAGQSMMSLPEASGVPTPAEQLLLFQQQQQQQRRAGRSDGGADGESHSSGSNGAAAGRSNLRHLMNRRRSMAHASISATRQSIHVINSKVASPTEQSAGNSDEEEDTDHDSPPMMTLRLPSEADDGAGAHAAAADAPHGAFRSRDTVAPPRRTSMMSARSFNSAISGVTTATRASVATRATRASQISRGSHISRASLNVSEREVDAVLAGKVPGSKPDVGVIRASKFSRTWA